ncbi:MAG: dihydrolipoyl dehydrogenase family protein [Candidatus Zixiibacteriota bacterium]
MTKTKNYDIIVIGNGSGAAIAKKATKNGLKTLIIDKDGNGGTCINYGCIPSKNLISPADMVHDLERMKNLGIDVSLTDIDFEKIMSRMHDSRRIRSKAKIKKQKSTENLDFINAEASFVGEKTIEVKGMKYHGKKIFINTGAKPMIPPIDGTEDVPYLTNESLLELKKKPESIIIIGGGYIGVEFENFFSAMGTDVTIVQRDDRLVPPVLAELSDILLKLIQKRSRVLLNSNARKIKSTDEQIIVEIEQNNGKSIELKAEKVLIATGRRPATKALNCEKAGIKLEKKGFVIVDQYYQTTAKDIYAIGDCNGKAMFKHIANKEAEFAWHNAKNVDKKSVDYDAIPYAIYSHPNIAAIGLNIDEAVERYGKDDILIGHSDYWHIAKGFAIDEKDGQAIAIVHKKTDKILGFNIIGPQSPVLIQEIITTIKQNGTKESILDSIHIHPALSEIISTCFSRLQEVE